MTITTGTRAEYGILRPILKKIAKEKKLQLFLLVTGTHLSRKHGMTVNEIKKDGSRLISFNSTDESGSLDICLI